MKVLVFHKLIQTPELHLNNGRDLLSVFRIYILYIFLFLLLGNQKLFTAADFLSYFDQASRETSKLGGAKLFRLSLNCFMQAIRT